MDFLIGAIFTSVFFILVLFCLFMGYQLGKKKTIPPPNKTDDEEIRRAKKMQDDFAKLMSYDIDTALQSKKVISGE